ncbi:replication endonuclease [Sulfurimonas sp.]|uniref:replication endonuclease n=1 Tax=Sulfurimonas sp. TaxID=2022749 RepID=UPI0026110B27|nr:replication endonuclease [Sulfurimonas sp.]MDD5158180.1 replication endonuclease [Sulfurimonas sp.]
MNCIKNTHKNSSVVGGRVVVEASRFAEKDNSFAVGTLTNYKEVVDIDLTDSINEMHRKIHYGLSKVDLDNITTKLKNQKSFLDFSFIYDRINHTRIPLSDIVISANHSPHRYYSEIQNRVNTLQKIAEQRGLKPLFMTLTLPSEYHSFKTTKKGNLVPNPKFNNTTPKESVKALTKMFARLRQDRALKDGLHKDNRIYFRVNEPHKDGTPHTHILMFVPSGRVEGVKKAFKRLFDERGNDIQDDIKNSTSYIMKYINKTLPLSKKEKLSEKEKYLNAWYSKNRVVRFNSSKTLAPLSIYRLLHNRFSMFALTRLINENHFKIYVTLDTNKVIEITDEWGDTVYARNDSFNVHLMGNNFNYLRTNDSAIGRIA